MRNAFQAIAFVISGFCFGAIVAAFWRFPPNNSSEWASWIQAIGAIVTIGVTWGVMIAQRWVEARKDRARADRASAEIVLSLQHIARELGQICDLGCFQKVNPNVPPIYGDIAAECEEIVLVLRSLPLTAIAPYRLTDYVFGLRRLASQIAAIYASDQQLDGEAFVGRYQKELSRLKGQCRAVNMAFQDVIKNLDEELHLSAVDRRL